MRLLVGSPGKICQAQIQIHRRIDSRHMPALGVLPELHVIEEGRIAVILRQPQAVIVQPPQIKAVVAKILVKIAPSPVAQGLNGIAKGDGAVGQRGVVQ